MMQNVPSNQEPAKRNRFRRIIRELLSYAPLLGVIDRSRERPEGISVIVRVKDESDWVRASLLSIKEIADEIVVVDNGSLDSTVKIVRSLENKLPIRLYEQSKLGQCELSNFALSHTRFRWVFRWDGDMVAHTTGDYNISHLRRRILSLNSKRYYLIYLRHINLAGDLFHQDPKEMVHIEEYIHTFSDRARYIHPGRFEAVKVPKYYRPLFWYEPYSFHVNVKPARRMLLRYFWEDWMELKDYEKYPKLEDYVDAKIKDEFETDSWEKAERLCVKKICSNFIRYDSQIFGPYPDLLKPYLQNPKYRLKYKNSKVVGRDKD